MAIRGHILVSCRIAAVLVVCIASPELSLADPPSRKGSVWSLSFHAPGDELRLVAADYVRDPAI